VEDWTTLEQQITDLWKSRGLEVLNIKVEPQSQGYLKWTVLAKEKEEPDE